MCRPVKCRQCDRITWAGCGAHVDQVRATVPADNWCDGHPKEPGTGFLSRLFRRG